MARRTLPQLVAWLQTLAPSTAGALLLVSGDEAAAHACASLLKLQWRPQVIVAEATPLLAHRIEQERLPWARRSWEPRDLPKAKAVVSTEDELERLELLQLRCAEHGVPLLCLPSLPERESKREELLEALPLDWLSQVTPRELRPHLERALGVALRGEGFQKASQALERALRGLSQEERAREVSRCLRGLQLELHFEWEAPESSPGARTAKRKPQSNLGARRSRTKLESSLGARTSRTKLESSKRAELPPKRVSEATRARMSSVSQGAQVSPEKREHVRTLERRTRSSGG